jgi:hypothetical protein
MEKLPEVPGLAIKKLLDELAPALCDKCNTGAAFFNVITEFYVTISPYLADAHIPEKARCCISAIRERDARGEWVKPSSIPHKE